MRIKILIYEGNRIHFVVNTFNYVIQKKNFFVNKFYYGTYFTKKGNIGTRRRMVNVLD